MKEKRVWIGLAVLFAIIGAPQLFWKPSRFGGIFLLALAIGCMGEWLMLCGREKHKACRILSRVGRVLFALFVLSFAAVQVFVIGIAFDEDDPSAAPQADYYLVLGALVNPNGQPSAALAARCDTAIAVLNVNPGSQAILCGLHDRARCRRRTADPGGQVEHDHPEYRQRKKAAARGRSGCRNYK